MNVTSRYRIECIIAAVKKGGNEAATAAVSHKSLERKERLKWLLHARRYSWL